VESAMPVGPARPDRTGKGAGGYPDDMKKGSCRCLEDGSVGCLLFSLADDRLVASADGCMERRDDADAACPLPPRRAAGGVRGHGGDSAPTGRTAELLAELLDPTGLDDPLLGARIERMRVRRDVELEQRILLAVVHLDGLAGIGRRPGDELEAARHVLEDDVAILWVDTFFHGSITVIRRGSGFPPWSRKTDNCTVQTAIWKAPSGEAMRPNPEPGQLPRRIMSKNS